MAKKEVKFTACYRKSEHGYMGKLLEWPGVLTEGENLEECRDLLREVTSEMSEIYKEDGMKIPYHSIIVEPIFAPVEEEALLARVS